MPCDRNRIRAVLLVVPWVLMGLSGCDREVSAPIADAVTVPPPRDENSVAPQPRPVNDAANSIVERTALSEPQRTIQQVFRPNDRRPLRDDSHLKEVGIRVFESKHLKLYTDIDPAAASTLPALIDQAYDALEAELGPLPPDRAGTDFQMTGYLFRDIALFREFGLLDEELVIVHGRHRGNEFWMREQKYDYYRRHLLIHEATHCFMTYMPGVEAPLWYLEGMAEYFGTHRLNDEQHATFQVMPTSDKEFYGFGRIVLIRDDIAAGKFQTIRSIFLFKPDDYRSTNYYAWSWALCVFLDRTPRYHDRFQKLASFTQGGQFYRQFQEMFEDDERDLSTEWLLFATNLQFGYDLTRAAIDFQPGTLLSEDQPERTVQVDSGRGWQSTQVRLEAGQLYEVVATGQFTLADSPKPWLCEPQGITFRYFDGRPLGLLVGCIRSVDRPTDGEKDSMLKVIPLGRGSQFQVDVTGTLYLRLNDAWNSLDDNRGHAIVVVRKVPKP